MKNMISQVKHVELPYLVKNGLKWIYVVDNIISNFLKSRALTR